jgi:hypothetical protein
VKKTFHSTGGKTGSYENEDRGSSRQACRLRGGGGQRPSVGFAALSMFESLGSVAPCNRGSLVQTHLRQGQASSLIFQRHASNSSQPPPEPVILSTKPIVYVGSMSHTLKKVKLLSITSCALSMLGAPVITFWTAPTLPLAVKTAVSIAMVLFGAGTTGLLHWFSSPYVHKLLWTPGSSEMEVHTLTWLATTSKHTIRLDSVGPAETQRPLVTFAADGKFYYVDGANFVTPAGKELRQKLLGSGYQD